MAAPLSVACPHCQTAIKLKSAASVGKKARCPKCQQVFVVPAVEAEEDEFAGLIDADANEFEDYGGDEDGGGDPYADAPASRPSAGRSKKGKKKRKSRGSGGAVKGLVITLVVLVVLGLLGGGGYLAVAYLPLLGFGASTPMAWLPDDTVSVVQIRMADLWSAPVLNPLKTPEISGAITNGLTGEYGLRPEEIDRVVIGTAGSAAATPDRVSVVYCKAALTEQQHSALTGGGQPVAYNGGQYYMRGGTDAVYLPRDDVAVIGNEQRIKAAIDSGGKCAAEDKFDFAPSGGNVSAAFLNEAMPQGTSPLPGPMSQGLSMFPSSITAGDIRCTAVSVTAGADLKIDARIVCKTSQQAESMVTSMQSDRDRKLTELQQQKTQIQPNPFIDADQLRALVESQEQMLSSAQMSSSGDTARVSLTIPAKTIEALADMVSLFSSSFGSMFGSGPPPTFTTPNQTTPTYPGQ